jgi:serine/threonine protein kinase
MDLPAKKQLDDLPDMIANRYRVEETIGEGGMAVVYKVYDIFINRRVALKQLNTKEGGEKQARIIELFEREFHTLSHLSHPRLIAVYDYGVSELGPFYTMELLDGGDLRKLSPVNWEKACKLLLGICSALSLLHSRRMVHRDLSPRNIRCTSDGLAKLIDFGAMIPMGPCKQTVGTPPFVAPEVVNLQTLDGRTDLYSLGATLYYTLTGRNAFPARNFNQLPGLWRVKPLAPSEYVETIPKALDTLVMQLIYSDPHRRPVNAAEVMERLSAIANLEIDDQLQISQAYLSTPTLVGRERNLVRVRKRLIRAQRGRGKAILVRGVAGVGRSRFVDACVLEGKLMGAIVIRADATDAQVGEYGVVRELVSYSTSAEKRSWIPLKIRTKCERGFNENCANSFSRSV